jgi:WS/DGAT/MGAT family acyltransferase
VKHLSGFDDWFLRIERPNLPINVTGVGVYEPSPRSQPTVEFEDVVHYARQVTLRSPGFRQRLRWPPLGLDQPYWEEDLNFDVANHVFHLSLPSPGNRKQLDQEVARVHNLTIDRSHPLWEWWFIDGLDTVDGAPPGSFALVFKAHHATHDGTEALRLIESLHEKLPDHPHPPGRRSARFEAAGGRLDSRGLSPVGDLLKLASDASRRVLARPGQIAGTLWGATKLLAGSARRDFRHFPLIAAPAPDTIFNCAPSGRRVRARIRATLAELNTIRTIHPGSTINDAILAIVSGGLRRYLIHHGRLPDRSLVVGMPISIRDRSNREEGNELILAMEPLCTDNADPVSRLGEITYWTAAKKEFVKTQSVESVKEMADYVPGPILSLAIAATTSLQTRGLVRLPFNTIVSSMRASPDPLYFLGSKMIDYDFSAALWHGLTLMHVATSYTDSVSLLFDADPIVLPDSEFYATCLDTAKRELLTAAALTPPARA